MTSPISLLPPDPLLPIPIDQYREGNTGIAFAHRLKSDKSGPKVLITALIHGNEVCGAHALDLLLTSGFKPLIGELTVVFCNVAAYMRFDPLQPGASRCVDEDMNRVWADDVLASQRSSADLERAREILPLVREADFLLDIHSMQTESPALVLSGPHAKGRALAAQVGVPAFVVADKGHKAGLRMRDHGAFGEADTPQNSLLVECGQHWQKPSRAVAIETMLRFLIAMGQATPDILARHGIADTRPAAQTFVEVTEAVTIESEDFRFRKEYRGLEIIPEAGSVLADDGAKPVRTPYDNCVLIMPTKRLRPGQTAVRLGRILDTGSS